MQNKVIDALHEILDAEKSAILCADYDALGALEVSKENLLKQVPLLERETRLLATIKGKILANQALLRAAIDGLAAAKARIDALQNVRDGLNVYDQSGKIATVPNRLSALEKKA